MFRTDFVRRTWIVTQDGARIEAALDTGTITAPGQAQVETIQELELEWLPGADDDGGNDNHRAEAALRAFAARLAHVAPLTPSDLSKAARGYRLDGRLAFLDLLFPDPLLLLTFSPPPSSRMQADFFARPAPAEPLPSPRCTTQVDALPAAWRTLLAPCLGHAAWDELARFVDGERAAGASRCFRIAVFHALP